MEKILTTNLRILDAHAHLGNWEFNRTDEPYKMTMNVISNDILKQAGLK